MSSTSVLPYNRGLPIIGNLIKLAMAGSAPKLHLYIDENHKKFGPIYRENFGGFTSVFVGEPKSARKVFTAEGTYPRHVVPEPWILYNEKFNCKRGLFFMENEDWLKHRRILNPILLDKKLAPNLQGVYDGVCEHFLQKCSEYNGREIENIEHLLYCHSISFTVANLLGTAYLDYMEYFQKDINLLGSIANSIFKTTTKLMNTPVRLVAALKLRVWNDFVKAVNSSLIASRNITEKMMKSKLSDGILKEMLNKNLDFYTIQTLILDLMLAAGDTTAYTTLWALYLLGKHPAAVDKLRADPDIVRGILRETLRLYPAAIFISRYLHDDLNVLEYNIPKGELMIISMYTIGRTESIYPEAEEFIPERWTRNKDGQLNGVNDAMAYFPFAHGVRSCIGRKIAEAQIYHTLTKLLMKYDIELKEPVDMELHLVPVPVKPIKLTLKAINVLSTSYSYK